MLRALVDSWHWLHKKHRSSDNGLALFVIIGLILGIGVSWGEEEFPEVGLPKNQGGSQYVQGKILVRYLPQVTSGEIAVSLEAKGARLEREIVGIRVLRVEVSPTSDLALKLAEFSRDPRVEFAERDAICWIARTPSDPYFSSQWGLENWGEYGTPGADVGALQGWDWETGAEGVIIAIVDTGVSLTHPDLAEKILPGYDFVNNDDSPQDDNGHGTHVAGIAAALTDNGVGIAGVAWESPILPVKVMGGDGSGAVSNLAAGIMYAADQGAEVINVSIQTYAESTSLQYACQYAYGRGALIAAAAGNFGDYGFPVAYPARYDDYCLAVAATDYFDQVAYFSNYGAEIDVAAPGVGILSTYWTPQDGDYYAYLDGTSMATPFVAGQAALIMADKPRLTNNEVMRKIRYGAIDVNSSTYPGVDQQMGYGRVSLAITVVPLDVGGGKKNCFIATAVYGDSNLYEVNTLRRMRDRYLAGNLPGRLFLSAYYRLSPPVARFLGGRPGLRGAVRCVLGVLVAGSEICLGIKLGEAVVVTVSLSLIVSGLAFLAARRIMIVRGLRGGHRGKVGVQG